MSQDQVITIPIQMEQAVTKEHFSEYDLTHFPKNFYVKIIEYIKNQVEPDRSKLKLVFLTIRRIRMNKIMHAVNSQIKLEDIKNRLTDEEILVYSDIQTRLDQYSHSFDF